MSRHPELNHYICQVLLGTKALMAQGAVRKLAVCIFDEGGRGVENLVEKLLFDIRVEPGSDQGGGQGARQSGSPHRFSTNRLQEMEDELRSAILQIDKSSVHLPSRHGCTFALHVEAHEHGMTNGEEQKGGDEGATAIRTALRNGTWFLADSDATVDQPDNRRRQLVPIKSVRADDLKLDVSADIRDFRVMG